MRLASITVLAAGALALSGAEVVRLAPGKPLERRLAPGESHLYEAPAAAGQFVQVTLEQGSADLSAELVSPAGDRLVVDGFEYGPEPIAFMTHSDVAFHCRIQAAGKLAAPTRYTIALENPRAPTPEDQEFLTAQRLSTEAKRMQSGADPESRRAALEKNRSAALIWRKIGHRAAWVSSLVRTGDLLNSLGDSTGAREQYRTAVQAEPDGRSAAEAWTNAGVASLRLGDIEDARDALEKGLDQWKRLSFPYGEAAALNNLGLLCWRTGEWQSALNHYLRSLDLVRGTHPQAEALVLNNLGLVYLSLADYSAAMSYLTRTLPLLNSPASAAARGRALLNLGRAHMLAGEPAPARKLLREAYELLKSSGDERSLADAVNNLGQLALRTREPEAGWTHLKQALAIYQKLGDRRGEASTWHHLGLAQAALGDRRAALDSLRRGLDMRLSADLHDDAAQTLVELARLQRELGEWVEARRSLESALRLAEMLRIRVAGEALRASYFAARHSYYEEYTDLLMQLHENSPTDGLHRLAFEVAERARARCLLDLLAEARGEIRRGAEPELLARERVLLRRLNFKSDQMARLSGERAGSAREASLRREIDDLVTEYHELEAQLRDRSPAYADLVQPRPLAEPDVRRLLDEDTVLLEFGLGSRRSFLWALTSGDCRSFVLPGRAELEEKARTVVDLAQAHRVRLRQAAAGRRYQQALAALGQMLFAGAGQMLARKRWVLVGEGALNYLPFAALPDPLKPERPLGVERELITLPSASVLASLRAEKRRLRPPAAGVVILGDPVFDATDPRLQRPAPGAEYRLKSPAGRELARLPFSRREVEAIAKLTAPRPVLLRLGFDATKAALSGLGEGQFRALHIATHALIDDAHPELSGIALSQVDDRGRTRDGLLRVHEVYNLNLPVDLVVLSACRTGLGKEIRGEGIIGFTRAFLYAGASQVVVSLWKIDDEATAEFMSRYYRSLLVAGSRPAAALRAARDAMWRQPRWRDSFYWSGFTLQGDWTP